MNKDELLEALRSAATTERSAALCIGNVISTFAWSGLTEPQRETVVDALHNLAAGPQLRADRLGRLIDQVERSHQDVF